MAHEAALLLYSGMEEEYFQAKRRAADSLNVSALPSNREIAEELDQIAEEAEGSERRNRLIRLRRIGLKLMECLKSFEPSLVGSVWRGTATKNSDIDIRVCSNDHRKVETVLLDSGYSVLRTVRRLKHDPLRGFGVTYHHIYVQPAPDVEAEVVVRESLDTEVVDVCEIYGDLMTGLRIEELRETLTEDPLKRFVPK